MNEMLKQFDKNLTIKCNKTEFWEVRKALEDFATHDDVHDLEKRTDVDNLDLKKEIVRVEKNI